MPNSPPPPAGGAGGGGGGNVGGAGGGGNAAPAVGMTADQLPQLIQAVTPAPAAAAPRRKAEKRLAPFSTGKDTDWLAWKATYLRVAELNDWDEEEKRKQILASMEGLAMRLVQTIKVDAPVKLTSDQILTAYENRFLPPAAGQLAREDFREARQRRSESVNAWHTRISEIFARAYPARDIETDSQLIEQYVGGFYHPTVQERTFVTNPTTMTEALNTATSMVAAVRLINAHSKGNMSQWIVTYSRLYVRRMVAKMMMIPRLLEQ